jgi:ATP-dependent Clp protease ATP-binding subunit ClpA
MDYQQMSRKELHNYVLANREDEAAFHAYVDLLDEVGNWTEMPALKSPQDLDNYPEFIAHITRNSKKPLNEAAIEIQRLLKQLEETNPTTDEAQKIAYINIAAKPELKRRTIEALRSSGERSSDELVLEDKYLNVVKAVLKDWMSLKS